MHPIFEKALSYDSYRRSGIEKSISGTSFLAPTQRVILSSRYKQNTEFEKRVSSFMGTAFHNEMEKEEILPIGFKFDYKGDSYELIGKEVPFASKIVGTGMTATGTADLILLMNGSIIKVMDYKTCKDWIFKAKKFDKWIKQLSIYSLLAYLHYKKPISTHASILYYNKTIEANGGCSLGVKELKLMSLLDTKDFMIERAKEIEKYWDAPDNELPKCTVEEMRLCPWCGLSENCSQIIGFVDGVYNF